VVTGEHRRQAEGLDRQDSGSASPEDLVSVLQSASRALQSFLTTQARVSGLGLLEFLVLSRAAEGDGVAPVEVGRPLSLNSSTMTGLADRLEGDGLIRRAPHPTDRRLPLLEATAKGHRIRQRTFGPISVQLLELADALGPRERAIVHRFLADATVLVSEAAVQRAAQPPARPGRASASRRSRGRSVPT
jgi:DNA-binding MarR family transcriptional regulator